MHDDRFPTLRVLMETKLSTIKVEVNNLTVPLGTLLSFGVDQGAEVLAEGFVNSFMHGILEIIKSQFADDFKKIEKFHENTRLIDAMAKYSYHGDECVMFTETETYNLAHGLKLIEEQRQIAEEIFGDNNGDQHEGWHVKWYGGKKKIFELLEKEELRLRRTLGSKPGKPGSAFLATLIQ